jgi:hypothetical protein
VYAAALPVLGAKAFNSWQEYRDSKLLQAGSGTSLYFHPPQTDDTGVINMKQRKAPTIHILMGRTYAKSLNLGPQLKWLNEEFAVDDEHRIIVSPYFDYRQLSNIKIMRLVGLIEKLNYCTRA